MYICFSANVCRYRSDNSYGDVRKYTTYRNDTGGGPRSIGNMHKNFVKIVRRVIPEISSRTQTDTETYMHRRTHHNTSHSLLRQRNYRFDMWSYEPSWSNCLVLTSHKTVWAAVKTCKTAWALLLIIRKILKQIIYRLLTNLMNVRYW